MERASFLVVLSVVSFSCGPKPAATGPFYSLLALERWHRSDPAKEITMTGLSTFYRDERTPAATNLDEHCVIGSGNWDKEKFRPPSFGPITMKIADRQEVAFTESAEGSGYESASPEWDTGDTLEVTAAGKEAPGFDVVATVPAQLMLTSHDLGAAKADTMHLSRSTPLELAWNPGQGDAFLLFLQFPLPDTTHKLRGVWCTWPATSGAASVPTSVLQTLEPSRPSVGTNIYFGGGVRQVLPLDSLELDVITFKNEAARIQVD